MTEPTGGAPSVLKACPFCGGGAVVSAEMNTFPQVACDACGASQGQAKGPGVSEAIAAWNRRAADPVRDELLEALEPFLPAYHAYVDANRGFQVTGNTLADQRASESERRATAEEAAHEALAGITYIELQAVFAAITKAKGAA